MIFQESYEKVRIHNEGEIFECSLEEFLVYEQEYEAAPHSIRYWGDTRQYLNDGANDSADDFFSQNLFDLFCSKIPVYQARYDAAHPSPVEPVKLYATMTITGGDGKIPPGIKLKKNQTLQLTGDIRAEQEVSASIIEISYTWRITCCKVRSELNPMVVNSFAMDVQVVKGQIDISEFSYDIPGIYMIDDADFDVVDGVLLGLSGEYVISLVDGPVFFKVYY